MGLVRLVGPGLAGPKGHLGGHDPGEHEHELLLPVGPVELPGGQPVNLRPQGPQAGPELVALGRLLGSDRVHECLSSLTQTRGVSCRVATLFQATRDSRGTRSSNRRRPRSIHTWDIGTQGTTTVYEVGSQGSSGV